MIKFIRRAVNLWRISRNPTAYDKGLLRHLDVNPKLREAIKDWHEAKSS